MKKCPKRPPPRPAWFAAGLNATLQASKHSAGQTSPAPLPHRAEEREPSAIKGSSCCACADPTDARHPDDLQNLSEITTEELKQAIRLLEAAYAAHVPALAMHKDDDPELRRIITEHAAQAVCLFWPLFLDAMQSQLGLSCATCVQSQRERASGSVRVFVCVCVCVDWPQLQTQTQTRHTDTHTHRHTHTQKLSDHIDVHFPRGTKRCPSSTWSNTRFLSETW